MPSYRTMRVRMHRRASQRDPNSAAILITIIIIIALVIFITFASRFLKKIAAEMAISDATDIITASVNEKINQKMSEGQYDYDYFVTLQRDNNGDVTAISANMTRINSLSSEILREVIDSTNSGEIDLSIPLGNLSGSNLLLGRGPKIPVKVVLLTSSYANFHNEMTSAGINQIKHQIILEITVQIDVLMPWSMVSAEIPTEVLVAETVIVGKVPDTYLNMDTATLKTGGDAAEQTIGEDENSSSGVADSNTSTDSSKNTN